MIGLPASRLTLQSAPLGARLRSTRSALRHYESALHKSRRVLLANAGLYQTLARRWPAGSHRRGILENRGEESRTLALRSIRLTASQIAPKHAKENDWLAWRICQWGSLRFAYRWLQRRELKATRALLHATERLHYLETHRARARIFRHL